MDSRALSRLVRCLCGEKSDEIAAQDAVIAGIEVTLNEARQHRAKLQRELADVTGQPSSASFDATSQQSALVIKKARLTSTRDVSIQTNWLQNLPIHPVSTPPWRVSGPGLPVRVSNNSTVLQYHPLSS